MQYLDVAAILKSYTTKLHFSEFKELLQDQQNYLLIKALQFLCDPEEQLPKIKLFQFLQNNQFNPSKLNVEQAKACYVKFQTENNKNNKNNKQYLLVQIIHIIIHAYQQQQ